jgi:hypothetical protein
MKNSSPFCLVLLHLLFCTGAVSADATKALRVTVEIYEMPATAALALRKTFATGTDAERIAVLGKLRAKTPQVGIRRVAKLEGDAEVDKELALPKPGTEPMERYATAHDPNGVATAFEERLIDWRASLTVKAESASGAFQISAALRRAQLAGTQRFSVSRADRQGRIEHPVFDSEMMFLEWRTKVPDTILGGIYTPAGSDAKALGVVFLTVKAIPPP